MATTLCKYCKRPVFLFMTRSKVWQSLQPQPRPYRFDGDETPDGWVVLITPQLVGYVVAARDLPVRRLRQVTQLFQSHLCAEMARARYDRQMERMRDLRIPPEQFAAAMHERDRPS